MQIQILIQHHQLTPNRIHRVCAPRQLSFCLGDLRPRFGDLGSGPAVGEVEAFVGLEAEELAFEAAMGGFQLVEGGVADAGS